MSLSPDEVAELAECDPDDSSMPPYMRCAYRCDKEPTQWKGEENREALSQALKDQALAVADKEEAVKWVAGTVRGKVYVPRVEEVQTKEYDSDDDDEAPQHTTTVSYDDEYGQALMTATPTDIQDIADILGVTFQEHCMATPLKVYPAEAPNNTNIDEVIKQATANDPELQDINLNNLKYISKEKWAALFAALKDNSVVECLSACNCDMTDTIANFLCECLESNKTLRALNLESNSITADMVLSIIKSTANTKGLEELRVSNQFTGQFLGSALEYAIIELLPKVPHLVKLGVRMEFRDSLNKCAMALAKNLDRRRQNEDRTFSLQLDKTGKTGPKIVRDK